MNKADKWITWLKMIFTFITLGFGFIYAWNIANSFRWWAVGIASVALIGELILVIKSFMQ